MQAGMQDIFGNFALKYIFDLPSLPIKIFNLEVVRLLYDKEYKLKDNKGVSIGTLI